MKKCNLLITAAFSFFVVLDAFAQTQITGKVTTGEGQPLPGVSVLVKGFLTGASTGEDGTYTIEIPKGGTVLEFRLIGFRTSEITIGDRTTIDVTLGEDASKLEEVVVVGYGKQSRELLTTAVAKLDNEVLENIPYNNAASALQGTIPGLRVQTTSGMPGNAPRVILRGGTSINSPNSASPLYIIDGIIRSNMNEIFADDIESVQVLKDAASTAIYGARGSNGVVIVTTKSGKPGKSRIQYSFGLTSSEPTRLIEYASARDYIHYSRLSAVATAVKTPSVANRNNQAVAYGTGNDLTKNTAYTTMYLSPENQHKLNEGWESMPDPLDPSKTIIFKDTNFQDLIFRNALSQKHYLSASGGSEKASFYAGAGYISSQGIAIETDYTRFGINFAGSVKVSKKLDLTGKVLYARKKSNDVALSIANTFYRAASLPGSTKYAFEDGSLAPGLNRSLGNPDYHLRGSFAPVGEDNYDNTNIVLDARWSILPGLYLEPRLSMYAARADGFNFTPAYLNGVSSFVTTRNANASYSKTTQYNGDAVLTYLKSLGMHNMEVKVGFSHNYRENYSQSSSGRGAATDNIPTLNASSEATDVNGSKSIQVLQGVFSRINYDYNGKYLLTLNMRYDGVSNLGSANRFGFFPGISAGWNLHKEKFWDIFPQDLLELKLRGSYGVNGNISGLGDFEAQGLYSVDNRYGNEPAIQATVIPNENLRWEESKTLDVGFDAGLFNRRLSILFDYYNRRTDNLLTNVQLPASSGYSSVLTNFGSLQNKGFEFGVGAQLLPSGSGLEWSVSVNAAKVKTKILKLPDNGIENNRQGGVLIWDPSINDYAWKGGLQEGGRIGDYYSVLQTGVYTTDEEAANAPEDMFMSLADKTKYGGDAIFADLDGDGMVDDRDKVYLGNPYPTWTGGFTNTLRYKGLSLTARLDFATGHTIFNYARAFADGQLQGDALPTKTYFERMWKKPGDITNTPRYIWHNQQSNISKSSVYYEKGDYLALREITLSYKLPASVLGRVGLSNVRFHVTGNNLHYFTSYQGPVPEEGGRDNGHYPIPRNLIFGVNVEL